MRYLILPLFLTSVSLVQAEPSKDDVEVLTCEHIKMLASTNFGYFAAQEHETYENAVKRLSHLVNIYGSIGCSSEELKKGMACTYASMNKLKVEGCEAYNHDEMSK